MRILSGIQPSGTLHLGNYFGMMRPAIALQEEGRAYYFIADYHAMTTVRDAALLRKFREEAALDFLACGLDPEKTALFPQSSVPEVTELAWILGTVTPMGLLERCHSYKDKLAKGIPPAFGLFSYPVLMAADILLYDSDVVPVGKDQKQHLEVTRDIAIKFNEVFGETFKLPEPRIQEAAAVVPGIDGEKMSKSYGNTIELFMPEKELRKRVMSIKTDSTPVDAPKPVEGSTILALYRLLATDSAFHEMEVSFQEGGKGYGHYKTQLFEAIRDYFEPMRKRREEIVNSPGSLHCILAEGTERARSAAAEVMGRVRKATGL